MNPMTVAVCAVIVALLSAAIAASALARLLDRLQANHHDAWRALGSPRMAGMAPGAGPRLFRFLRNAQWQALEDAELAPLAGRAWGGGLASVCALVVAVIAVWRLFVG